MDAKRIAWLLGAGMCVAALATSGCSKDSSGKAVSATTSSTVTSTSESSATVPTPTLASSTTKANATTTSKPVATTTEVPATTPPTVTPPPSPTEESDASRAEAEVRGRGFTPRDTTDFATPPTNGLHVIVAAANSAPGGHQQQAFFFVNGKYLRTDLPESSAEIKVAWRNETTIALGYAIYKAREPICCPSGGSIIVRYKWTGTQLQRLDPIPTKDARR